MLHSEDVTIRKVHTSENENYGRQNVRKHCYINNGDKYTTLDISLNFDSTEKIKIIYSEPKDYLGRKGNVLITYLGLKTIIRSKKNKKSSDSITNVSLKNISKIIKTFKKLTSEGYTNKRPSNLPIESYLYLSIHLAKCIMRLNMKVGPVRTQMTNTQKMNNSEMSTKNIPNLHVCSTEKIK